MRKQFLPFAFLLCLAFPSHGLAEDKGPGFLQPGIHADWREIRLGVLAYDRGFFSTDDFSGAVINGEFLFNSPEFLDRIGSPRPYIGFDAAIADDPVHFIYTGLNWDFHLFGRLYLSTSVGGAITTAENLHDPSTYKAMGCRALFHLGAAIGYDVGERWTLQAYADHFSNAGLCSSENNGAEATGVRIGYRF
ncbi:acyloxyacyl hydrolase [Chelativorans sp. AA-79]|uniref:acyloxyacyl hydrolase n=1 Tax=Chelativorans sp. AA-79 TaxID=3028735 RepID=UPI0023F78FF3|nr:acyloxyacyl hydrolase [Chelativorans sp. AA-79]WEX07223.1 acyloxyacyl hydrolase [Chelativorans sp. AA-79]